MKLYRKKSEMLFECIFEIIRPQVCGLFFFLDYRIIILHISLLNNDK